MSEERVIGSAKAFGGKAEKISGTATDSRATEAPGAASEVEGTNQNAYRR